MKYSKILEANNHFKNLFLEKKKYSIHLISNIVVNQLTEILEYYVRDKTIPGEVSVGNYDNIIQESHKKADYNLLIIFWEISNYLDGLHYKADVMSKDQLIKLEEKIIHEIELVFKYLKNSSLVLFNKFSSLIFNHSSPFYSELNGMVKRLNSYIEKKKLKNFHFIDIDKVIANVGISNSVDFRYYYSSKALYTINFYKAYSELILPHILAANGRKKKALILDCDNTLWKGVIGEDGLDKINLSSNDPKGKIFNEIQNLVLALKKNQGALLGLCSKNNSTDVDEVLKEHPDMIIRDDDIVIKKVNWNDKATNLKEISDELNIGLDSIVFIDDSDFEIELIKQKLPEITSIKVPSKIYEYPAMMRKVSYLFFDISKSAEDQNKTEMYKQQNQRKIAEKNSNNIEDYLSSLELKIKVFVDDEKFISRMAQMTQKTNQFNLTTARYTETDLYRFVLDENFKVICISVSDKFGDSGITGLCILKLNRLNKSALIDTLLMSCRVIGRNIEFAFVDKIIKILKQEGIINIEATYQKTIKNSQVSDLFDKCDFNLKEKTDNIKYYFINLKNYQQRIIKYIEVINGK